MKTTALWRSAIAALALTAGMATQSAFADAKKEFNIAWSIYVGWMPWPYAADAGIVKKWGDKYGITINITQINDYVESINQYTAGKFDGVTVTNMDALTIPAAGGVDSSAIIMGDFSNGNDGVVLKDGKTLADIKGRPINIVELSVSHYLLARGLASIGLTEKDVKTVNTSDVDIVAAFKAPESVAVVTWNPQLMEVKAEPTATEVFDSSKIPGEIEDMMVVDTETLKDNPDLGKALADIKGRPINIVELSVSHYLLARGLASIGLTEKDVKTVNTSDVDIVAAFKAPESVAVVTWNPQLMEVKAEPTATEVFDSSKIPGEIEDMMVVNTETLKDNPDLGKALVGIWYETIALMKDDKAAREAMGKLSGTDLASFEAQLKTTRMFYTPQEALAFTTGPELPKIMDLVRTFSFEHNLLGENVASPDVVGIWTPAGGALGDANNVKLRFDPSYMQMAADGKL